MLPLLMAVARCESFCRPETLRCTGGERNASEPLCTGRRLSLRRLGGRARRGSFRNEAMACTARKEEKSREADGGGGSVREERR